MRAFLFTFFCSACVFASAHEQPVQREVLRFSSSLSEAGEAFADSKILLEKLCRQSGLSCSLTAYSPGRAVKMLQDSETAGELPRFEEFQNLAPAASRVPTALGYLSFSLLTHDKNIVVKSLADLNTKCFMCAQCCNCSA